MRNLYIWIIIVLILAIGVFIFVQKRSDNKSQTSSTQTASACDSAPTATSSATIAYSDSGFSPSPVSISSGGTLTVKNHASNTVQFSSDPHPIHTDNPDLNMSEVRPGQEQSVTVNKTGCFGYHDHFNPDKTGKILIK